MNQYESIWIEYKSIENALPGKTRHVYEQKCKCVPKIKRWLSERFISVCKTSWRPERFSRIPRGSDSCYLDVKDRSSCTQTWSKAMVGFSQQHGNTPRSVVLTGLAACRSPDSCPTRGSRSKIQVTGKSTIYRWFDYWTPPLIEILHCHVWLIDCCRVYPTLEHPEAPEALARWTLACLLPSLRKFLPVTSLMQTCQENALSWAQVAAPLSKPTQNSELFWTRVGLTAAWRQHHWPPRIKTCSGMNVLPAGKLT